MPKGNQSGWRSILYYHTDQGAAGGKVGPKDVSCLYETRYVCMPPVRATSPETGKSNRKSDPTDVQI
jgi:hypothetical protein